MINLSTSSQFLDLGVREYEEVWNFQKKLHFLRYNDLIEDTFIFVEHSPGVYTIGRGANPENYKGLNPILIERGGDVTYHGLAINYGEASLEGFMKIRPCGLDSEVMGYLGIEKNKIMDSILDILQSSYRKMERKNEEYFIDILKKDL